MKFWPFSKKSAPIERKSVLGVGDTLSKFLLFGYNRGETPSSAMELYNTSSAVSVPVNRIAEAFASIQPVLENENGDLISNHPIIDLLQQPSPFYDGALFLDTLAKNYLITNECEFIAIGNINRPPLELQPISPQNITVSEGQGGFATSLIVSGNTLAGDYRLTKQGNKYRYLEGNLKELKQIRGFSTKSNGLLRGQSVLVSAANEVRQHIMGNRHNVSLLEKGGRLSLVFHFEEDMSADDFEAVKEAVRDQFGGADNAGKIGITSGGKMTVDELGTNNKDMDFALLHKMSREAVALVYKFPLALLSTDAATFNNYKEAKLALFDDAVLPLADRLYSAIGQFLLPRYGLDPKKYSITYDILSIPALRTRVLDELKVRKDINIESDNELRAIIAREPYHGGDQILKPANLVPVGTDLITDNPEIIRDIREGD